MPDTPHTVFVSHAHADNALCDRYVEALRKRGLDVWYDRANMQVGHSLSSDIEAELRKRSAFVVMATPASLASQWVRSEIAAFRYLAAQDPSRLFVPVRVAECEMPLLWMDIRWIDAVTLGFDAAIDALAGALRAPATPPPTAAPATLPPAPSPASAPAESVDDLITRYDEELAAYERALAIDPNNAQAWVGKAAVLHGLGRYAEALTACERALAIDPNNAQAWYGKSEALRRLGRYAEALDAYERVSALDPNNAQAWYGKSEALRRLGRYAEALAAYERALALDPTNTAAWYGKGTALRRVGREDEASEAFRRAWELLKKK